MKKLLFASLVLCLFALGITPLSVTAQGDWGNPENPIAKLEGEGWRPVAEGVMQRERGDGQIESLAFGAEGYAWMKKQHERQLARLVSEYEANPSQELLRGIRMFRREIAAIEQILVSGELQATTEKLNGSANGCNFAYGASRNAYPLSTGGAGADSSAYFHNDCGYTGQTEAWAYATATSGTVITTKSQRDPKNGTWIDSAASASAPGNRDCYSEANAWTRSDALGLYYNSGWRYNSSCYPPFSSVTVNGPTDSYIVGYSCTTITWTATLSGGSSPLSYTWKRDGVTVSTSSSYAKSFCGNNTSKTEYVNLHLDVRDASGVTRGDDHTTKITYLVKPIFEGPCGGSPCVP